MVTGKWKLTIESPIGKQESTLDLGETAGTLQDANGTTELKNIVIEGETAKFDASIQLPFGAMEFKYELTADGDTLSGQSSMAMGTSPITGVRI